MVNDRSTLFEHLEPPPEASGPRAGPFAGVALEQGIDRVLDYSIPSRLSAHVQVGQRVRVPLGRGNHPTHGYVVSIHPTSEYPKIKNLLGIEDDRVLVMPRLMELARWMSRYYATPLGVVLETVIPSSVKKRIGLGYSNVVRLAKDPSEIQTILETIKAPKRRSVLARLLQLEKDQGIELVRLAGESGTKPPTIRKLAQMGLITIRTEVDLPRMMEGILPGAADQMPLELNVDQKRVFDELAPRVSGGGFSVHLLHGVTGSGKTEFYLQSIAEILKQGKGAIVLVPEIALTPQTVRRFMGRFKRVAVLHSGLSAAQRHRFWQQINSGGADVVVGARSAIFAPMPNVGMIVVDEEHDASYKQDQAPRFHGRDVAIKRAQIEGVPILLGSATPSLEMYWKSRRAGDGGGDSGKTYHYLSLPNRVRQLALPTVELVDMRQERRMRRGVHLISQRLERLLKNTIDAGQQAIVLLNRRGYSNFVYCSSCTEAIQCKYCDTTMTYHRSAEAHAKNATHAEGVHTGQLHCHYCLAVNPLPEKCPACGKKLSLFGLGTQRVEEELAHKMPGVRYARVDSDSMRNAKDYEATLARFGNGEIQVMLGTQMIAKGLDYPNVTLVGVISGDTALALPDFRAAERTFQLITQVAGRAGRGDAPGRVVLQTFMPDDPTIRAALRHDYEAFAAMELPNRKEVGLPPFTRLARIIIRHQEQEKLHTICGDLAERLTEAMGKASGPIDMRGPMPCAIQRIAGHYRNQIVLYCARPEPIQEVFVDIRAQGALSRAENVAVDVDPVSLL